MRKQILQYATFWVVLILLCLQFMGCLYIPIPGALSKSVILLLCLASLISFYSRNIPLKALFLWMILFLGASCVSSYYFRGQNVFQTLTASYIVYSLLFYFLFYGNKLELKTAKKIVAILAIIYSISYVIQYLIYPTLIFDLNVSESLDLTNSRLRLQGSAMATLGFFYFLNRSIVKANIIDYALTLLCFLPIFFMGFRTMLVALILCSILMIILIDGLSFKLVGTLVLSLSILAALVYSDKGQIVISSMVERQNSDNFSNDDYVRVLGMTYYMTEHFKSPVEMIFGSGMYYSGSENEILNTTLDTEGLRWNDWGIVGLSFYTGFFTIGIMIFILVKNLVVRVPKNYLFLTSWIVFMFLCSITTAEFLRLGNTIILALVIYMIQRIKQLTSSQKKKNSFDIMKRAYLIKTSL